MTTQTQMPYYAAGIVSGESMEVWGVSDDTPKAAYEAADLRIKKRGYTGRRVRVLQISEWDYNRARSQMDKGSFSYLCLSEHPLSEKEQNALFVPMEAWV